MQCSLEMGYHGHFFKQRAEKPKKTSLKGLCYSNDLR